jgi:hypothetical protein
MRQLLWGAMSRVAQEHIGRFSSIPVHADRDLFAKISELLIKRVESWISIRRCGTCEQVLDVCLVGHVRVRGSPQGFHTLLKIIVATVFSFWALIAERIREFAAKAAIPNKTETTIATLTSARVKALSLLRRNRLQRGSFIRIWKL